MRRASCLIFGGQARGRALRQFGLDIHYDEIMGVSGVYEDPDRGPGPEGTGMSVVQPPFSFGLTASFLQPGQPLPPYRTVRICGSITFVRFPGEQSIRMVVGDNRPNAPARRSGQKIVRRLAAVLAWDISGYSAMMGRNEEGTHRRVGAEVTRVAKEVERANGRIQLRR